MNTNMRKPLQRLLAISLSFAMLLGLLPMTAFAESDEQFSLAPGGTYYFNLSAQGVPGTVNTALPDTSLKWVPFTYAGTVNAYSLDANSSGDTSASGNATPSDRSLFVADYNISHTTVSWNDLNGAGLIFGKAYNAGGVAYTLRSLSGGSDMNNQPGDDLRGTPETNEWDQILNKDGAYLKNWNGRHSWGQDTSTAATVSRVYRGSGSARHWYHYLFGNSSSVVGFRPALEILDAGTLGANGLKTVTYDMDGNGTLGSGSLAAATVVYTGDLTLPAITSANGFAYTGSGTGALGWHDGAVFHPAGTSPVLASGAILKAGREPITAKFTDSKFLAEARTALGKGASDPIYDTDDFASVTDLDVSGKNISSLAGIEYFTALTSLNCSDNYLESLDLSNNTALTSLNCSFNQLTSLDVSHNTALTELSCGIYQLTELDLSSNTALTSLNCGNSQLTELDLSKNTALTSLDCGNSKLTELDLSENTAFTSLYCYGNPLTSLDLSKNTALTELFCYMNQLGSLDLSKNTVLTYLYCSGNQLTALDLSKNTALTELNCSNNQLGLLDLSSNTALTRLYCDNNQLTELDLSKNAALDELNCYNNQLGSLDLSENTVLTALYCYDNPLATLDVSSNIALTVLSCGSNQLSALDVSHNTALTELLCGSNQLTALDLSNNTALTWLSCSLNQLSSLNVSNNAALSFLSCDENWLTALDVSNNESLTWLDCKNNYMPDESAVTGFDAGTTTIFSFYPQYSGPPPVNAVRPSITRQPAGATYTQNASAAALSVTATIMDSGTLSYQWYKNASNRTTGGMPVGINSSVYTPLTNTVGTTWYYCVVTNTNPGATGNQTAAATSNTAAVTVNAPGDNGGSSGGGATPPATTPATPQTQPNQPTAGTVPVTATPGANGTASAVVSDNVISDAIAKAQADAKAQGNTANGISVALNVTMPQGATALTATLTQGSLNSLVSAGVSQLEINGAPVSLGLDLEALKEILRQSNGNISISFTPATGLSEAAKALLGNRPVYNITISYTDKNGKAQNISNLGSGAATISIPYAPDKNEVVGYLFGVYVDGNGNAIRIDGSAYDPNSGSILLDTDHFSVYGVGYEAPSAKFTDIGSHWAKESIDYVVGRGLLSGTSKDTFAPDTAMTRGMLVTALGRFAAVDVKAYATNSFTDVKADSVFRPYIEWAYQKGIVQGTGNQQFAPDRAVTREEIAVIFANFAKADGYKLPVIREASAYADASSIGSSYLSAVKCTQQAGIMMGGTGNRFNPKAGATRAEVAAILHRYVKLTIDPATAQGWALGDDGRYLYYKDGKPLTGWQTIDGVRYFFRTDGTMQTGWVKDGNHWRYYSGNKALTFWQGIGGKRYYFTEEGLMIFGKWLEIGGKQYYFHADGSLAVGTRIDGYEVDENGVRKTK